MKGELKQPNSPNLQNNSNIISYSIDVINKVNKEKDDKLSSDGFEKEKSQLDIYYVEKRYCTVCNVEQPIRSKHCKDCKRCVAMYDHHCPWTGNCVGEKNHCFFYTFLILQMIQIVLIGQYVNFSCFCYFSVK